MTVKDFLPRRGMETASYNPRRAMGRHLLVLLAILSPRGLAAQQPFVTDDAAVTGRRVWHFEFSDELDRLSPAARPARWQNTARLALAYGAAAGLEIALDAPLIAIESEGGDSGRQRRRVFGLGDASLGIKYLLREETPGGRRPALAASLGLEIPTGDVDRQLGSGVEDYALNGIVQKTLGGGSVLRGNLGAVLSGNTVTGALGIRTRGLVWTGGVSLTRSFTPRLDLGLEVSGATSRHAELGQEALQALAGGNWLLRQDRSLDFALLAGRRAAAPRYGVQIGFSADL